MGRLRGLLILPALILVIMATMRKIHADPAVTCKVPSDIIFVLDGSESVKNEDFEKMKNFVKDLLKEFQIADDYTQVGLVLFGTYPLDIIELGATNYPQVIMDRISGLTQPVNQVTGTAKAIERMRVMFGTSVRPQATKVGVVITDGRSMYPENTKIQSNIAKSEGIHMIAIGFGSAIFRTELEQIASSTDLAFLQYDLNMLKQQVDAALKSLVCQEITTPAPITTTTPLPTPDRIYSDACPNCLIDKNRGLTSYPGDCNKYVMISPDGKGGRVMHVKSCPFGTFFELSTLTCQYSFLVNCVDDPCKGKLTGTFPNPDVCSSYWSCINGVSFGSCCTKPNQRFIPTLGCIDDPTCMTSCPPDEPTRLIDTQVCHREPHPTDRTRFYEEEVPGGDKVPRYCAQGTAYVQADCACTEILDTQVSLPLKTCSASTILTFDTNSFTDISGSGNYFGVDNVAIINKAAHFYGDGMINMWRFSGYDFRQSLAISFSFQSIADQNSDPIQALVSNCLASNLEEATILISIVTATKSINFRTTTDIGEQEISTSYNANSINHVIYMYNGQEMAAVVNDNVFKVPLEGNILRRQTGVILGAGSNVGNFQGKMDEFQLFTCMPPDFAKYL